MKYILLLTLLSGCAMIPCPGTTPYDPQLCRGERWVQYRNFEYEAIIRRENGEEWWKELN
jgi:hypothetical protein